VSQEVLELAQQLAFDFGELSKKSREWRAWYYDGDPKLNPVAEPVKDAFELINATLFGHIYQRPALEGRIRSICTVAALVVLNRQEQLPGHITGALNYGWTKEQIVELITQMLFYGGYPVAGSSLNTAARVFAEYDKGHPEKAG
jgi:4-carboxymuconolactone decarboxylase